jgi:hypothetical protein
VVLKADTGGLSREEAEKTVDSLAEVARAGRSIAVNESVEATVVDLTPDIDGLTRLLDKLELGISANFGVPRMLLGRPVENRATAYAELEAYYAGTIAQAQRYLKREVERQWYAPLVEQMLAEEGASGAPVRVKHSWKPIRASDTYEMAKAVSALWGSNGDGALGGDVAKAWSLMGWSPEGEP